MKKTEISEQFVYQTKREFQIYTQLEILIECVFEAEFFPVAINIAAIE
jgi:hypothetical protein